MEDSSETKSALKKIKMLFKKERLKVDLFGERIKKVIQILGWLMFFACVAYWIAFMFIIQDFEALLHTTYFTIILISFTCILKLESVFLNTMSGITFYGFLTITIGLIPETDSIGYAFVGPVLHGSIACFQVFLVFHPKIPMSKKYLLWGILFYLAFMVSYDDYHRFIKIIGLEDLISLEFTKAYAFYTMLFSSVGIYLYKKKFGIMVN